MAIKKIELNGNNVDKVIIGIKRDLIKTDRYKNGEKIKIYWSKENFEFLKSYVEVNRIEVGREDKETTDRMDNGFSYYSVYHFLDKIQEYYNID
jgi:hypothetical protein